jgi:hypothetical protein
MASSSKRVASTKLDNLAKSSRLKESLVARDPSIVTLYTRTLTTTYAIIFKPINSTIIYYATKRELLISFIDNHRNL